MQDGYYWYYSASGDEGDLDSDEPQIVMVNSGKLETWIYIMGGDLAYTLDDAHGRFDGPIAPKNNRV